MTYQCGHVTFAEPSYNVWNFLLGVSTFKQAIVDFWMYNIWQKGSARFAGLNRLSEKVT